MHRHARSRVGADSRAVGSTPEQQELCELMHFKMGKRRDNGTKPTSHPTLLVGPFHTKRSSTGRTAYGSGHMLGLTVDVFSYI